MPSLESVLNASSRALLPGVELSPAGHRAVEVGLRQIERLSAEIKVLGREIRERAQAQPACRALVEALLHCADSYFCQSEMAGTHPHCTLGLSFLQLYVQVSKAARRANQARLRELREREPGLVMFCSHDPDEFDRLSSAHP